MIPKADIGSAKLRIARQSVGPSNTSYHGVSPKNRMPDFDPLRTPGANGKLVTPPRNKLMRKCASMRIHGRGSTGSSN